IGNTIAPVGAPVAIGWMLRAFLPQFDLQPMGQWHNVAIPILIAVLVGSSFAYWPIRKRRTRILLATLGAAFFFVTYAGYSYFAANPPTDTGILAYDLMSYITFYLTYFFFGMVGGHIGKILTEWGPKKRPPGKSKSPARD